MLTVLVLAALLISLPLMGGGLALYLDNPPHLAEIHAAAHTAGAGWSDDAWCGFPVGSLHSPLWYAPLSWIARAGGDVAPFYFVAVLLGFLAPALAMYKVARRSLDPPVAGLLAFVLLIQRPAILGVGSAFGGMWTFYLSAGFFILLVDELARPNRRVPWLSAALTGLILLSHLFPVAPLAVVGGAALLIPVVRGRLKSRRAAAWAGALSLGVLVAALYWLPMLLAGELAQLEPQVLTPGKILARLLVPTDILAMLLGRMPSLDLDTVLGAVPMILLVGAGSAGAFFLPARRNEGPVLGLVLTVFVLGMLLLVVGRIDVKILGPVTWRLLYFARVGLAFAALPVLALWPATRPRMTAALAPVMLAVAFVSGLPLEKAAPAPASPAMADLRRVWTWLEANRRDDWGRVHLQDTFHLEPGPDGLGASHVMALTARETGVRQVGSFYSIAPYATVPWTSSEYSTLFGQFILEPGDVQHVVEKAWLANVTHIVVSDQRTEGLLKASGAFDAVFDAGRFEVLRWRDYGGEWGARFVDARPVPGIDFVPGRISIPLRGEAVPGGILVKASYHPFWRLTAETKATLAPHASGLMEIQGLAGGEAGLELEYRPPAWPKLVSLLAVLGIAALAWRNRTASKRAGP